MRVVAATPLFNMTSHEGAVFKALSSEAQRLAQVVGKSGVAETSAKRALASLQSRGLVRVTRVQGQKHFKRVSESALKRYTQAALKEMGATSAKPERRISRELFRNDSIAVEMITGQKNIMQVFKRVYSYGNSERSYLTQLSLAMKTQGQFREDMKESNRIATESEGILELIMTPSTMKQYSDFARDPSWVESQANRKVDFGVLPEHLLPNTPTELFIYRDTVMLTDWSTTTSIVLRHQALADVIAALFRAAKLAGEPFDVHSFVKAVSERYLAAAEG